MGRDVLQRTLEFMCLSWDVWARPWCRQASSVDAALEDLKAFSWPFPNRIWFQQASPRTTALQKIPGWGNCYTICTIPRSAWASLVQLLLSLPFWTNSVALVHPAKDPGPGSMLGRKSKGPQGWSGLRVSRWCYRRLSSEPQQLSSSCPELNLVLPAPLNMSVAP